VATVEFLKPAFVVLVAWAFSEGAARKGVPGNIIALMLFPLTVGPLVLQPDFGQTMLISMVWAILFFMRGCIGCGSSALAGSAPPRLCSPINSCRTCTRASRRFSSRRRRWTAGVPTNFQSETALESFISGSWLGKGPGEGTIKRILPDSHTDYIFAVIGEEFGVLVCIALARCSPSSWCAACCRRPATRPFLPLRDGWPRHAVRPAGLHQHGVNLQLMPAKGMTLPFVSYGGSS